MCWQEEEQAQAAAPVEPGDRDEANPWLRRAGWAVYLAHTNVPSAMASMRTPVPVEDAEDMEETAQRVQWSQRDPQAGAAATEGDEMMEHITAVLWQAMDQVAWVCQTATKELGHFLRTKAICTEKHQTQYTLLLAYMNEESIWEHVRLWQQIIMFFTWTQCGVWSGGKQPWYGFTPH